MLPVRLRLFLLINLFGCASLSGCQTDDPQPITASQLLVQGNWRLDQIKEERQPTLSGASIKDSFSLRFHADGTYAQQILADKTVYTGTWELLNNEAVLHFTDHKGVDKHYILSQLKSNSLQYSFLNKEDRLVTYVFTPQP